jgi:PAS domain S-box-containing protein
MATVLAPLRAEPLRVGVETDLVPISFADEKGRPQGFSVDLIKAIARESGLNIELVLRSRAEAFEDFSTGRLDALSNVVRTKEREATMAFSVTDLELRSTIFVRSDGPAVRTVDDLRQIRIAGILHSQGDEYLRSHGLTNHFVAVGTVREELRAVEERTADATVATRLFAAQMLKDDRLTHVVPAAIEFPDLTYRFYIALHPEDRIRLAALNEGLMRVRASGEYDKIYEKWIGPLEARPLRWKDLQPFVLPSTIVLLAILGVVLWQRHMLRLLAQQAEALRRSEQRLTLMLEGGEHGLWDWDISTGAVERNSRTAALLGYVDDELPSTHQAWLELVHAEDRASVEAALHQVTLSTHDSFVVQYRMKAKDGQWRWINSRGKVLDRDAAGRPRRAAGTHTDVTAQKRMEEERVAFQQKVLEAQKLESLGLLAGGIAHDFNNLLTVVLGQASLLRITGNPTPEMESGVQQIEAAARRASDLCRQMLVYAGGGSFAMEHVDFNALLTGMAPLLRHSVRKDARLEFELSGDLPAIEADPTQIRQIVMNLVINASEALGPNGGIIRVITSTRGPTHAEMREAVYVSELPPGRRVCLTIADNGAGMSSAVRAKIFEPFFTTKFTGRGLGLAAVLGIVRAHHGIFSVHSEPGVGTSFTLFLTASPHPAASATNSPIDPKPLPLANGRATILIADDEPAVLAMSVAVLRHHGYEVVSAANGREAVEKFLAEPSRFGAVVLDFTMPELNGVGALMEIRKCRPSVPAVLMSGFGAADAFERLPAENPPLFLQKPFAQHELLTRLAEAVALGNGDIAATPRR